MPQLSKLFWNKINSCARIRNFHSEPFSGPETAETLRYTLQLCLLVLLAAALSHAGDVAILRNGNSIRNARHEVLGQTTRLYMSDSGPGYIEIPTSEIDHFEHDAVSSLQAASNHTAAVQQVPTTSREAAPPSSAMATIDRQGLNLLVNGAGQRHQIDPDFINSVIRAESGFNTHAVSKKGAQGLMQLMPQTASQLGVANSFDPNSNVEGGTKYLRALLEKYNYDVPKALAAYNAGPKRVDQYRGVPPYNETRAYVASIIRDYNRKKLAENPSLAHKTTAAGRPAKHVSRSGNAPTANQKNKAITRGPETASR